MAKATLPPNELTVRRRWESALRPTDADRKLVEHLAGVGLTYEQIAALMMGGITTDLLARHFKKELITGKAKASQAIARTLYQKAMSGDTACLIFWAKSQMKWSEAKNTEEPHHPNAAPTEYIVRWQRAR